MAGNANSGRGSGALHRSAILDLLEVHTEGATATELASYIGRHRVSTREQLLILQDQAKVFQRPDGLWKMYDSEAAQRVLTPSAGPKFPLHPPRTRSQRR